MMGGPSCSDICEMVHHMLLQAGFKISPDDEDHTDMVKALNKCKLVRT